MNFWGYIIAHFACCLIIIKLHIRMQAALQAKFFYMSENDNIF